MNESDMGKALLQWDARQGGPPEVDPNALTQSVLKRDRWRVRILAGLTVLLWFATAAGILWLSVLYFTHIAPRLEAIVRNPERFRGDQSIWIVVGKVAAGVIAGSFIALTLAALSTILLVFATRRATLRQVNANLAAISGQLKELRDLLARGGALVGQAVPDVLRPTSGTA